MQAETTTHSETNPPRISFRAVWQLAAPYWTSEDWKGGWTLLITISTLVLGQVYISVLFNHWNNDFYNSLQNKDLAAFWHQLGKFSWLAVFFIAAAVYRQYFMQMLQIRWRQWMTRRYSAAWLDGQTYYRLQVIYRTTDNPDQRIAEDLDLFANHTLSLGIGLLGSVVTLCSFVFILWELSGVLEFALLGHDIAVPGYMVWVALVYALLGTWLTHRIGRRLVLLNYNQQRFEADFRYAMVRLREHAESIAFYRGEAVERHTLTERFSHIVDNWWQIMRKQKQLTWFTSAYGQIAIIFPILVAAPRYFAGAIQLGGLMQTASAFGQVQGALSWFIDVYPQFASWKAATDRLHRFTSAIGASVRGAALSELRIHREGEELRTENISLLRPDGSALLERFSMALSPGERLLIAGPSGSGKTTLLRALAGLWPFGTGDVYLPAAARVLFIPQKPYLPILTLREALCYPEAPSAYAESDIENALIAVGLSWLKGALDMKDHWAQRLSLGEQQKLAFARALLFQPDVLLLDEATASLDEAAEETLYGQLIAQLPRAIIISVSHRPGLGKWHTTKKEVG